MSAQGVPYWRLSLFYFFYFGTLGALSPYWPLYLKSLEFSSQTIGFIGALLMGTKIVAPNLWGWLADHTGQRLRIVRLGSLLAFLGFLLIFWQQTPLWVALVVALFSFFWSAVISQFEVITLRHLGTQAHAYSRIRVWGSVGFIVAVMALGTLFDWIAIGWLPWLVALLLAGIWLSTLLVGQHPPLNGHDDGEGFGNILRQPAVLAFFGACFLLQLAHGPYYTFYSLHLENHGYSRTLIGSLWALGVFAEVLLFMAMHRLLSRWSVRQLLAVSLAMAAARWWLIGAFPESLTLLLFAQVLHAFTFGVYHAAAIEFVRRRFSHHNQGRGQALYSSLSYGLGGALGAAGSGLLWDWSPLWVFVLASVVSALAWLLVLIWVREPRRPEAVPAG